MGYKKLYLDEKIKTEELNKKLEESNKIIEELRQKIEELNNSTYKTSRVSIEKEETKKGALCSVNGGNYEKKIHSIIKYCSIDGQTFNFNTQNETELGGSSSKNDIICNYNILGNIGIEVKKYNTPDWMQCSIKYDKNKKLWFATQNSKIPDKARIIFNKFINKIKLFNGEIPPFMDKEITHEEWINIKKETTKWNDSYIDIPSDTIRTLYTEKGCQYIQISDGYGLYHLGNDECKFNVPIFDIEQQIRIRTKIHHRKNKKGFCDLSVTIACQPKNIKSLPISPYSLDDNKKLPVKLKFNQ
jgi:hypothetical protein